MNEPLAENIYLSVNPIPSIHSSIYPSINLSTCLFIYLLIYQSMYQSINLSIYLAVNLSVYQSVSPSVNHRRVLGEVLTGGLVSAHAPIGITVVHVLQCRPLTHRPHSPPQLTLNGIEDPQWDCRGLQILNRIADGIQSLQ